MSLPKIKNHLGEIRSMIVENIMQTTNNDAGDPQAQIKPQQT